MNATLPAHLSDDARTLVAVSGAVERVVVVVVSVLLLVVVGLVLLIGRGPPVG